MARPFAYDNSLEKLLRNELLPDAKFIEKRLATGQPLVRILVELALSEPLTSLKEAVTRALADEQSLEAGLAQVAGRAKWPAEKAFWQLLAKGDRTKRQRTALWVGLHHFYETNLRQINLVRAARLRTRQRQRLFTRTVLPVGLTASAALVLAVLTFRIKHQNQVT